MFVYDVPEELNNYLLQIVNELGRLGHKKIDISWSDNKLIVFEPYSEELEHDIDVVVNGYFLAKERNKKKKEKKNKRRRNKR